MLRVSSGSLMIAITCISAPSEMKVVAVIEDVTEIKRVLRHLASDRRDRRWPRSNFAPALPSPSWFCVVSSYPAA